MTSPELPKEVCCEKCWHCVGMSNPPSFVCTNQSCECHSPVSLEWADELKEIMSHAEYYDHNELVSFIRTKLAEQKLAIVKALPEELPIPKDPPYTENFEWDKGYNAYRQAALKVIETL